MKDEDVHLARTEFPAMKRSRLLPDFDFLDDRGSTHSLREVLGDFTVLAFTHCDKTTHGPVAESLTAVVAENRGVNGMDVRGIDIHWSDAGCGQHDTCHLVDVPAHALVLCDATGALCRLYGVGEEDRFFVIGPDRHVIDSASVKDVARLGFQLSLDVALCTDGTARSRPWELGAGHAGDPRPTAERETPNGAPILHRAGPQAHRRQTLAWLRSNGPATSSAQAALKRALDAEPAGKTAASAFGTLRAS